jgi:sulfonate transport system substrate-binding protein
MTVHKPLLFSRLSTLVAFFLLLLNTACSSNQTLSQEASSTKTQAPLNTSILRLGIIGNTQVPTGPIGWAIYKGKLKPELEKLGIKQILTFNFPNGPDLNEALVAEKLDIGIYGDTPALIARARGIKTRLISQEQVGTNAWLLVRKDGPRSVAELKGQKVATSKGSYMHRYLIGLLQKFGIAEQVTVVHLLPNDARAALERGDVAAIAAPIGTGPILKAKGFPVIDEAVKHSDLPGTSATVITEAFLAKHPDLPKQWNQVKQEAVKDINAHPEEYYKFHAQVSKYPIDVVKASFSIKQFPEEPFSKQGLQLLEGTKKFLVSQKLAKSDFELSDWILAP